MDGFGGIGTPFLLWWLSAPETSSTPRFVCPQTVLSWHNPHQRLSPSLPFPIIIITIIIHIKTILITVLLTNLVEILTKQAHANQNPPLLPPACANLTTWRWWWPWWSRPWWWQWSWLRTLWKWCFCLWSWWWWRFSFKHYLIFPCCCTCTSNARGNEKKILRNWYFLNLCCTFLPT